MAEMDHAMKRAHDYAAIFLNVGERWQGYVPVDHGKMTDRSVVVGDVLMERAAGNRGWRLTQGDTSWVVKAFADEVEAAQA